MKRGRINANAVRQLMCAQIDEASATLGRRVVSDSEIHGARKCIKKARATLRLMRDALPRKAYGRQNLLLRDAARPLSGIRDARILIEAQGKLEKDLPKQHVQNFAAFHRRLEAGQQRAQSPDARRNKVLAARRRLRTARGAAARWRLGQQGPEPLRAGLQRVYARGRQTMRVAKAEPGAEQLHEWRKEVKYLWQQLQILQPLAPGAIAKLAECAHELSDRLGEDHDLAVLRAKARQNAGAFLRRGGVRSLHALIDEHQGPLRKKAFSLGARLYREPPKQFVARLWRHGHLRTA
jgi:CHAD domain-containing protein